MKILVIDDTQKHLDAAVRTLADHDLTLCSSYDEAMDILASMSYREEKFDVVLSDLQMPVSERTHGQMSGSKVGQLMPFGLTLALTAARNGAKYVGCLTDANHHNDVSSAMLDPLDNEFSNPHIFNIDGAKVLMTNFVHYFEFEGEEEEIECYSCHGQKGKFHRHCSKSNGNPCFCTEHGTCEKCNGTGKLIAQKKGKDWGYLLNRLTGAEE